MEVGEEESVNSYLYWQEIRKTRKFVTEAKGSTKNNNK